MPGRGSSVPVTVSCVVLTRDEEKHIVACLETLAWADDLLVVDSGSTDATVDLARGAGARVEYRAWRNYPDQRNAALDLAACEWVFFVDADERATGQLAAEIRAVIAAPGLDASAARADSALPSRAGVGEAHPGALPSNIVGFWVPRHNIIFGKVIMHTGWYPDYQARLFRRGFGRFDPSRTVHELPIFDGAAGHLRHPLVHHNYDSVRQFLAKQFRYADYDAQRLYDQGLRPRLWAPLLQPIRQFRWRFFTLQGYLDGGHGLLLSILMAYYDAVVYTRLRRRCRREQ